VTRRSSGETVRVLVVDDDPRVRAGLHQLLASTPDLVLAVQAGSVPEARGNLGPAGLHVDVALVDVTVDTPAAGLSLIADLARVVPVVALSIDGAARARSLAAGAATYLEKSGSPDELVAALRAAADPDRENRSIR
jgi:DNA-binding NarL/FixJ family response regulator